MLNNPRPSTELRTSDFYYDLPPELIAQTPAERRDGSRLLVLDRSSGIIEHKRFFDLPDYLRAGDVLVLNSSKVIPARLFGHKFVDDGTIGASAEEIGANAEEIGASAEEIGASAEEIGANAEEIGSKPGHGALCEIVLLRRRENDDWECLARPGRRLREGARIRFSDELSAEVLGTVGEGNKILRFCYDRKKSFFEILDRVGAMPTPPYIKQKPSDPSRYQTVYANKEGSAAAPTAGLHFTPELLEKITNMGVSIVKIVLHVGLGTFRPVKADKIADHVMHGEYFEISAENAEVINHAKSSGGRLICVGTTSCRAIESAADDNGTVRPVCDDTGIFIYPGYKFKAVDALITNFHLPESTLLMLVSAFAEQKSPDGRAVMLSVYETAIKERYRFFSFGDAMMIR